MPKALDCGCFSRPANPRISQYAGFPENSVTQIQVVSATCRKVQSRDTLAYGISLHCGSTVYRTAGDIWPRAQTWILELTYRGSAKRRSVPNPVPYPCPHPVPYFRTGHGAAIACHHPPKVARGVAHCNYHSHDDANNKETAMRHFLSLKHDRSRKGGGLLTSAPCHPGLLHQARVCKVYAPLQPRQR